MSSHSYTKDNGCDQCGGNTVYVEDYSADTNVSICMNKDCRRFSRFDNKTTNVEEITLDIIEWKELINV